MRHGRAWMLRRARTRLWLAYDWLIFELPLRLIGIPGAAMLFAAIIAEEDKPILFLTGVAQLSVVAAIVWRRLQAV